MTVIEELAKKVKDVVDAVLSIQDRELSTTFSEDEIQERYNNLTVLISDFNSFALAKKEEDPSLVPTVVYEMKRVDALANGAFSFMDELLAKKSVGIHQSTTYEKEQEVPIQESSNEEPQASTSMGAVPKQKRPSSLNVRPPQSSDFPTEWNQPAKPKRKVEFNQDVMQAIINQISNEFARMMKPGFENPMPEQPSEEPLLGAEGQNVSSLHQGEEVYFDASTDDTGNVSVPKKKTDGQKPVLQLKFEKIQIENFNGDLTEWIPFRDQFLDLVHNNENLTDITKFYQLRQHLSGLALEAINGFKMSASDYEAAWQAVLQRFDNQDQIIFEYIRQFLNLPILNPNSSRNHFFAMVDRTQQLLRVLPHFNIDVSSWDTILIYCLVSRLDLHTSKKWKDQVKKRQGIKISELIEFLEVEAQEASNPSRQKPKPPPKPVKKKANVMVATVNQRKCPNCGGEHAIFNCKAFLALAVQDRIKKVRELKICLRCLKTHDGKADCNFSCKTCQQPHNNLVCYMKEKEYKKKEEEQDKPPDSQQ